MGEDRFMLLEDAIEEVFRLAKKAANTTDNTKKAHLAIDVVTDFFVNNVFDGTEESE
jgi:hypothetical protein